MIKPYFESVRIGQDENTQQESECQVMLLWCTVCRLEAPTLDDFQNKAPKTAVFTEDGAFFVLTSYAELSKQWAAWLDAASNIQSVFTNN